MADKNRAEGNRNGETGSAGYRAGYRYYMEQVFPALAKQWKMKEEWNYKELYLAILEHGARKRRISRFRVYTPGELRKEIMRKQVP